MTPARVLFYVQHLLGIGHFRRAVTLVDAMSRQGLQVTMVSGGFPVPGMAPESASLVQLPPAGAADLSFRELVDEDGKPVTAQWKLWRQQRLLEVWRALAPHAIVVELFPFGRRQMRFELLPLLEAASTGADAPLRVSSVRDVLGGAQKEPAKQDQMLATFQRCFDHLLVHGDPKVIPFGTTFRHAAQIANRLHYTGYVVDARTQAGLGTASEPPPSLSAGEVLVSAGGGAVGMQLLTTAIAARRLSRLGARRWRLLAGMNSSAGDVAWLQELARCESADGIVVEQHRPDFVSQLAACRVSVSQGGYNTVMETLGVGARAVVVPFAGGAETEQTLRARILGQRGWIHVVEESDLTPLALARAIDLADSRPRLPSPSVDMHGAARSAELLDSWIKERFA